MFYDHDSTSMFGCKVKESYQYVHMFRKTVPD